MKILYVITKATWGGAQRHVYDLAVSAKEAGHTVGVAYGHEGLLAERLPKAGVTVWPLTSLIQNVSAKKEWSAFLELRRLIQSEKPDVVHVHSSKGGLALLASRTLRVPRIIFTIHGFAFNETRPWWQKIILRVVYLCTILLAHETICVSDAVRKNISLPFLRKRLRVIYNGIDAPLPQERNKARRSLVGAKTSGVWLGMIAELHPTKRIEDAIEAVAELAEDFPTISLFVLGEGAMRHELEEHIRVHQLHERVHLVGFKEEADSYLSAFDIFLMVSKSEALGYALLEAGALGMPVIATRVGGMPEVVEHQRSGLLVPPQNPPAIARAIRTLLEDKGRQKTYTDALKERVSTRFSKERMLKETFERYSA